MGRLLYLLVAAAAADAGGSPEEASLLVLNGSQEMLLCRTDVPEPAVARGAEQCLTISKAWWASLKEGFFPWAEPTTEMLDGLPRFRPQVERAVALRRQLVDEMVKAKRLMATRAARDQLATACWPRFHYVMNNNWLKTGNRLFFFATNESRLDQTTLGDGLAGVGVSKFEARLCVVELASGKVKGYSPALREARQVVVGQQGGHLLVEAPLYHWATMDGETGKLESWKDVLYFVGLLNDRQTLLMGEKGELVVFDHQLGRRATIAMLPPGVSVMGQSRTARNVDVVASSKQGRSIYLKSVIGEAGGMRTHPVVVLRFDDAQRSTVRFLNVPEWSVTTIISGDQPFVFLF